MNEILKRVQRKRTKGWRKPENTVCVTRPGIFGNPWSVRELRATGLFVDDENTLSQIAVNEFRRWLLDPISTSQKHQELKARRERLLNALSNLRGKNLACFCAPGKPCHADVLMEIANA